MPNSLRRDTHSVRDAVRASLWPIPIFGVVLGTVLGILIPRLDARLDDRFPGWLTALTFGGDAGAARAVLEAVASSLITVTALTFSLTVVTLQLASSQFSPRLLRAFTQDLFVQVTLAIFLATFTYSLTVLRSVRSEAESASPFVPRLAVTLSYLLALASVIALVLFLAHLTRQIRVETMLTNVHLEATSTIKTNLARRDDSEPVASQAPAPQPGSAIVWAPASGFLIRLDHEELLKVAEEADLLVRIDRLIGSFVVIGTPLGRVWDSSSEGPDSDTLKCVQKGVDQAVNFGPERTAAQDVGYGLRQLTDVANKALCPGVNDPTTAIHALAHTSGLLVELTHYDLEPLVLRNEHGQVRVIIDRPDFSHYLDLALSQPRSYGQADSQVLACLYQLLNDVAWHARPEQRTPIRRHLQRLTDTAKAQNFDEGQRSELRSLALSVESALDSDQRSHHTSP